MPPVFGLTPIEQLAPSFHQDLLSIIPKVLLILLLLLFLLCRRRFHSLKELPERLLETLARLILLKERRSVRYRQGVRSMKKSLDIMMTKLLFTLLMLLVFVNKTLASTEINGNISR